MLKVLFKELYSKVIVFIFVCFTIFWLYVNFISDGNDAIRETFTNTYFVLPLVGGLFGILISRHWGGYKSLLGRAILFFSFGLLAQVFGQVSYSYYYAIGGEVPYPSLGDLGFLGYVPLYMYGMYLIGQTAGVRVSMRSIQSKLFAFAVPVVVLVSTLVFFLHGYEFDWTAPLVTLMDIGYPLAQALNVSILVVVFILSRKYLGGLMRNKILFLLVAYLSQYVADFMFLYQINRGEFVVAGINEYLYLLSYLLMSLALIQLKTVSDNLSTKSKSMTT